MGKTARVLVSGLALILALPLEDVGAQVTPAPVFTHADTIRGSNTPERAWWDAAFFKIALRRGHCVVSGGKFFIQEPGL